MRMQADCVPCLMRRILFQARLSGGSDDAEIMARCLRVFADEFEPGLKSVDVASKVHAECYAALGNDDPYLELKVLSDEVASGLLPLAEGMVEGSDDPLHTALAVSAAGNIMDFGSGIAIDHPDSFSEMFRELASQGFGLDHTDRLREILDRDGPVVYIFDNCGECQMDKLVIRQLRRMGKEVVGVVREEPILNDVSLRDVGRAGLDAELDAVRGTGAFYVGIDLNQISEELEEDIARSCVVIAKGMGNYESLSDEPLPVPIAHILRAKCIPVASSIGVPVGTNVVLVREPRSERPRARYK